MTGLREARGWSLPDFVLLILMICVAAWVGREPLLDIVDRGLNDRNSAYVLFAPFAAIYLVWLRRTRLQFVRYKPSLWGPVVVILGLVMNAEGFNRDIIILWQAGVLVSIIGCLISMAGIGILRQFAPAFVAFFMVLPVPGGIRQKVAVPLQGFAAEFTSSILELLGVDFTRLGNQLVVNGHAIAVGETCNGMSMILALGLVVFVFVFSLPLRNSARVSLLILSPLIALVCNVLRLVPTSIMYGFSEPSIAESVYAFSAWIMIPLAVLMLIGVLKILRWLDVPITTWRLVTT